MSTRLTSAIQVSALLRRVTAEGGNGVVVARGDETAGAILIDVVDRGTRVGFFERLLLADGVYRWTQTGPIDGDSQSVTEWTKRRRSRDPDLWIIELDIANGERFIAETIAFD